jgi:hypothetical protein
MRVLEGQRLPDRLLARRVHGLVDAHVAAENIDDVAVVGARDAARHARFAPPERP